MILLPKEHGGWAILLVPYISGAVIGGGSFPRATAGLAASLAIYLSIMLAGRLWLLLPLGGMGLMLFLLHLTRILSRKERSASGELAGIMMLTLTAPLGFYLASSTLAQDARWLWLVCALYFSASVFYVKMKMRASTRKEVVFSLRQRYRLGGNTLAYAVLTIIVLVLLVVTSRVPAMLPAAFAPMLIYVLVSVATLGPDLSIKRVGVAQTLLSVAFGLLLIASYACW